MVNKTYTGIAARLEKLFDEPIVYFDKLPQGFTTPCFFIKLINTTRKQLLWKRSELKLDFDIIYYPDSLPEDAVTELNEAGYKLLWGLELITVDGSLLHGENLSYKIEDGVLHVLATYRLVILEIEEKGAKMESLTQQYRLKS